MADINKIFFEFALMFTGQIEDKGEIALPNLIDRKELDFSLNSLKPLDRYLAQLHRVKDNINDEEWKFTVLRGGAYLGEVIRRNSKSVKYWIDYNDYLPDHPQLLTMLGERSTTTCAFIYSPTGSMTMPLNKVARFIEEGAEHSTHYYASIECKE